MEKHFWIVFVRKLATKYSAALRETFAFFAVKKINRRERRVVTQRAAEKKLESFILKSQPYWSPPTGNILSHWR
jgi:hypothetical protein